MAYEMAAMRKILQITRVCEFSLKLWPTNNRYVCEICENIVSMSLLLFSLISLAPIGALSTTTCIFIEAQREKMLLIWQAPMHLIFANNIWRNAQQCTDCVSHTECSAFQICLFRCCVFSPPVPHNTHMCFNPFFRFLTARIHSLRKL